MKSSEERTMEFAPSNSVCRVLLVDDHEIVRSGLADLIDSESDLMVCGQVSGAPDAMSLLREKRPHIVIIDLSLADGSGIDLIKHVKASDPTVKMIVFSMHDDTLYAERALHAGAMGYVNKNEPLERILEAIREVRANRVFVNDRIANRVLRRVAQRDDRPRSPIETLSDRELEVLELIGEGMTTREIGEKLHLSVKTIDTYREHLKSKLELGSATELVRYAVAWTLDRSHS
jgi:DNA-binding NarL/FixJ family response regulator